jgi:hypothetical protein
VTTASGVLLAESLLTGRPIEGFGLRLNRVVRADAGDVAAGQPRTWTYIEFEVDVDAVESLVSALRDALNPDGGWYCEFHTTNETFVVFAGRDFRYERGSATGRAEAVRYGRAVGVPEEQLDWPE